MTKAPPRLPDWEARLNDLIAERFSEPFRWGVHDCALWGADVVHALTGEDFGAAFRGKYEDAEGAAKALREFGAGTVVKTFDRHLRRKDKAFASTGDVVRTNNQGAIGVIYGGAALCVGDVGLIRAPAWTIAWRV